MPSNVRTVAIVGGGITGLATAFYLLQYANTNVRVVLIEGSPRLGGKITSCNDDGFLVEGGPDSFIAKKQSTLELCAALGLEAELIGSNTSNRTAYIWSGGRLQPIPEGMTLMTPTMILPFLRSRLISWPGKLRVGMEAIVPRSGASRDESLGSFARRRLGSELLDKIAGPLIPSV